MVKNTFGGSKAKSFARKSFIHTVSTPLLFPTNTYECIGCVHRLLGNGRCLVKIIHPTVSEIQCIIRNKFRGRSKRNHLITVGSFVMVGLYDWEEPSFKSSDLLHVYTEEDVSNLRSVPSLQINTIAVESTFSTSSDSATAAAIDNFVFSSHDDIHIETASSETKKENSISKFDADIDFDFI